MMKMTTELQTRERRDVTINIKPYVGEEFLVTLSVPAELCKGSEEEWEYICFWIDNNLDTNNVQEWER